VSSHYLVRSSDGEITHMVSDADAAWHVQCYNSFTIGIEHEGYAAQGAQWYTEPMYQASAALVRWECDQHGIPKDRTHIIAHSEVPASCNSGGHTDPGPAWDWTHYMALVTGGTTAPVQGHLVGVVYSGTTANRLAAAHVVVSGGPTAASGVADASGYYTFDVDPGTYTVTASATGYQDGTASGTVTSGQTTWASVNLTAAAAQVGSYYGKVYIAGDLTTCIDGATATLTDSHGAVVTSVASNPQTVHSSDPQCLFRFTSVPVGTYTVKASAAGYTDGTSTQAVTSGQISYGSIGLTPGQTTVHTAPTLVLTSPPENAVSLLNPIAFEGTVTTAEGAVTDVEISVNGGPAQQVPLTGGAFASPVGIVSGANTVTVTASNGFLTATATRHLTFKSGADLIVVDRDHASAPIAGATVQLLAEGGTVQTQGTTAADGRVALDSPPGAYQLHVERTGYLTEDERVTLPNNARLAVTVPLSSGVVTPQPVSLYIDEPATGSHVAASPVAVRGHLTGTQGNVDIVLVNHHAATVKQDDSVGNLPDGGSTDWSASFELSALALTSGSNHIVVVASLVDGGAVTATAEVSYGTSGGSSGGTLGTSGTSGGGSTGGSTGGNSTGGKGASGGCQAGLGVDALALLALLGLRRRR
jgi:uncharacterized membrane protein YgcG